MAKMRGIKPETFTDDKVLQLSPLARWLFVGMWTLACDNGHLEDNAIQLKVRLLPMDNCDVNELVGELLATGQVTRHDGYLKVDKLAEHQRIDRRYLLLCEWCAHDERSVFSEADRTGTRSAPAVHTSGTRSAPVDEGEGEGEGEGEKKVKVNNPPSPRGGEGDPFPPLDRLPKDGPRYMYPSEFDVFYAAYPHARDQGNKTGSYRAWRSAVKAGTPPEDILAGAHRYREDPHRVDQYTKACVTWLNKQSWLDAPLPARTDHLDRSLLAAQRDMATYRDTTHQPLLQVAGDPYPWETDWKEIES